MTIFGEGEQDGYGRLSHEGARESGGSRDRSSDNRDASCRRDRHQRRRSIIHQVSSHSSILSADFRRGYRHEHSPTYLETGWSEEGNSNSSWPCLGERDQSKS